MNRISGKELANRRKRIDMAKLYFKVGSDWEEVVRLRNEIAKLNRVNEHGWHAVSCCFQGFKCPTCCI